MEKKTFNIIRYRGQPTRAMVDGIWVDRLEHIFVPEYGGFVVCASYDDHFIFEHPDKKVKGPTYQCTCGSAAVITGPSGYVLDASPQGKMFVCLLHANTGLHATGGTKWI